MFFSQWLAYNRVGHDIPIHKMNHVGYPINITHIMGSFLADPQILVWIAQEYSRYRGLKAGCSAVTITSQHLHSRYARKPKLHLYPICRRYCLRILLLSNDYCHQETIGVNRHYTGLVYWLKDHYQPGQKSNSTDAS